MIPLCNKYDVQITEVIISLPCVEKFRPESDQMIFSAEQRDALFFSLDLDVVFFAVFTGSKNIEDDTPAPVGAFEFVLRTDRLDHQIGPVQDRADRSQNEFRSFSEGKCHEIIVHETDVFRNADI